MRLSTLFLIVALVVMNFENVLGEARKLFGLRIVGGGEAESNDYPWMVSLQRKSGKKFVHYCGGTLIHNSYVLTAAHCVKKAPERVVIGSSDLNRLNTRTGHVLDGADFEAIPNWKFGANLNDIALIRLNSPILNIAPIFVNNVVDNMFEKEGNTVRVVGWGNTDEYSGKMVDKLRKVDLPLVSYRTCNDAMNGRIYPSNICAGVLEGGIDSCGGDSGGPLFYFNENTKVAVQVGIVSWGIGCAREERLGVYTRISSFIDKDLKSLNLRSPPNPKELDINTWGSKPDPSSGGNQILSTKSPTPFPTMAPTLTPSVSKNNIVATSAPTMTRCNLLRDDRDACISNPNCYWRGSWRKWPCIHVPFR